MFYPPTVFAQNDYCVKYSDYICVDDKIVEHFITVIVKFLCSNEMKLKKHITYSYITGQKHFLNDCPIMLNH